VKLGDDLSEDSEGFFFAPIKQHKEETCDKVHTLTVVERVCIYSGIGFQNVIQIRCLELLHMVEAAGHIYLNGILHYLRKVSWIL